MSKVTELKHIQNQIKKFYLSHFLDRFFTIDDEYYSYQLMKPRTNISNPNVAMNKIRKIVNDDKLVDKFLHFDFYDDDLNDNDSTFISKGSIYSRKDIKKLTKYIATEAFRAMDYSKVGQCGKVQKFLNKYQAPNYFNFSAEGSIYISTPLSAKNLIIILQLLMTALDNPNLKTPKKVEKKCRRQLFAFSSKVHHLKKQQQQKDDDQDWKEEDAGLL